jgi:hypothetical protein
MTETSTPPGTGSLPDPLEEDLLRWLFGDGEEDPGPLLDAGSKDPRVDAWLESFARDYRALRRALTDRESEALGRLEGLLSEIRNRRAHPIAWPEAHTVAKPPANNVHSLDAARARRRNAAVIGGVILAIAAAALFIVQGIGGASREVDVQMAKNLVSGLASNTGFGFAGDGPSPRERGFLLGAIADLARPRKATGQVAEAEQGLARELTERALAGLEVPDGAEARLERALGGCGAIFERPADRTECEAGHADYIRRRDAY